jgi:hypothetical protein
MTRRAGMLANVEDRVRGFDEGYRCLTGHAEAP